MTVGVVAAGDERTAGVGVDILRRGGNAVDAAVAANFAAFVAEPVLTAPFGGGFAIVAGPGMAPRIYDCFANGPGLGLDGADGELDFREAVVDFGAATQVFHVGRGAYACSSLLPGLVALHADHGCLPLVEVTEPAITMARRGEPISANIEGFIKVLEPILRLSRGSEALFAPRGSLLCKGDAFDNPDLAALLTRVGNGEPPVVREKLLAAFGPPHGRLTREDLDGCAVHRRVPVRAAVGDCEVLLNPPPSAGGALIAFALRLLETVPASVWQSEIECALHLVAAMAVSNAARVDVLDAALEAGDENAAGTLLGDESIDRWRLHFARVLKEGAQSEPPAPTPLGSTTHISILDAAGLACGITSSNGEGCGHLVPGAGAMANNFMGEEDLHPRGFHRHPPGRRLTSMMCPAVVLRDGVPVLVLGSGGSNRIRTAVMQVIVHHVLRGLTIEEAVRAPRLHYEGDCLYLERQGGGREVAPSVIEALGRFVPTTVIFETANFYFGGVHAVDGRGKGAGDPRRGGVVRTA